jgi:hypothetical protein
MILDPTTDDSAIEVECPDDDDTLIESPNDDCCEEPPGGFGFEFIGAWNDD